MGVAVIIAPKSLSPSGNQIYYKVRADKHATSDHRLIAIIHLETSPGSNVFTQLPEMNLDTDNQGYADIEISRIIHRRMSIEIPSFITTQALITNSLTLRFKVLFIEYWSGQSARKESSISTAIHAKVNNHTPNKVLSNRYLSYFPVKIDTYIGSIHYLTALFAEGGLYTARLAAFYSDGTINNHIISTIDVNGVNKVYIIPTGLQHRNLALPGKTLTHYTVQLSSYHDVIVFPKITYKVNPQKKKCIIYTNRLGGIDTFFIEKEKNSLKVERENYLKPLQSGFFPTDCDTISLTTSTTDTYEIGSGYITRKLQELYKELLISDKVFLVHQNNFLSINIDKGTFSLHDDGDDIYFIDFKMTLGFSSDMLETHNNQESYSADYDHSYE